MDILLLLYGAKSHHPPSILNDFCETSTQGYLYWLSCCNLTLELGQAFPQGNNLEGPAFVSMQLFVASLRRSFVLQIVHTVQTLKHNTANLIVDAHSHFKNFSGHN